MAFTRSLILHLFNVCRARKPLMHRWTDEELRLATGTVSVHLLHQLKLCSAYAGVPVTFFFLERFLFLNLSIGYINVSERYALFKIFVRKTISFVVTKPEPTMSLGKPLVSFLHSFEI